MRISDWSSDVCSSDLRGLALYVNEHHAQLLVLPVEVKERAVVDPTFATRDMVRALHRNPRHVVLVVSAQEARLFDSQLGSLRREDPTKFPMTAGNDTNSRQSNVVLLKRVHQDLGVHLSPRPPPTATVPTRKIHITETRYTSCKYMSHQV